MLFLFFLKWKQASCPIFKLYVHDAGHGMTCGTSKAVLESNVCKLSFLNSVPELPPLKRNCKSFVLSQNSREIWQKSSLMPQATAILVFLVKCPFLPVAIFGRQGCFRVFKKKIGCGGVGMVG